MPGPRAAHSFGGGSAGQRSAAAAPAPAAAGSSAGRQRAALFPLPVTESFFGWARRGERAALP
eukprot:15456917-Alexandrium_andersonii.AAC.2